VSITNRHGIIADRDGSTRRTRSIRAATAPDPLRQLCIGISTAKLIMRLNTADPLEQPDDTSPDSPVIPLQPDASRYRGKICGVVAENTVESARVAVERAPACGADLIELRLDYLDDFDFSNPAQLSYLLKCSSLPAIITCRSIEEGGQQRIDNWRRLRLLVDGSRLFECYCDIEAAHYRAAAELGLDQSRAIVSYHDFNGTPADLDAIYTRVCELPAHTHKIVTMASDIADTIPIFRLIERARTERRNLIALAMGKTGMITRIIGPARGGWLSYGTLHQGRASASGQLTCRQLAGAFRVNGLGIKTSTAGVIGHPVGHSVSPDMHNAAMAALGIDAVYVPLEVADVKSFFRSFVDARTRQVDWPLLGFSVTIPHKRAVMELVDELDQTAKSVGAVNTVAIRDGRLIGYNTDVAGAIIPLERAGLLNGERVAVIGAGGAARALVYGLVTRGVETAIYARDPEKARALRDAFNVRVAPIQALRSSDATVVVNTTPVGMRGHSEGSSPVEVEALRGRRLAYDLVYNPIETCFLRYATEMGCRTISGIDMLVAQAALQFELWTGKTASAELIHAVALRALGD
jgi:3-dehydroquinate dehydratase / shikimate dehydrogenase